MPSDSIRFIKQTFSTFRTTGAVAPSSRFLARAMVQALPSAEKITSDVRVLEVGAGTGAFTCEIAKRLMHDGHLTVYEINPDFVHHLRNRMIKEPEFQALGKRVELVEGDILKLEQKQHFDAIVSGLPFNNFTPEEVHGFLEHFKSLLKPGGTLTFFEYFGIRPIQMPFVGKEKRTRLKAIAKVVNKFVKDHQFHQRVVPLNLPPARARHFRFEAK